MKSPGVEVYIDGTRVPDGALAAPPDSPVALSGLTVFWGRETTVDQPTPASVSFNLWDKAGGQTLLNTVHLGSYVEVLASATITGAPTTPTFTTPPTTRLTYATQTADGIEPNVNSKYVRIQYTPGPVGGSPTDWDAIPRTGAGQAWRVTLTAAYRAFPTNQGLEVRPVLYTSPMDTHPVALDPLPLLSGGQAVDATFNPPAGYWLGLQVIWKPLGPAWDTLDATQWDAFPVIAWRDLALLTMSNVQIFAPPAGVQRQNQVFAGRVTDLMQEYDNTTDAVVGHITAQDDTADLANRNITQVTPWVAENLGPRWNRILSATGLTVASSVPSTASTVPVSWRDVDNQPALTLLRDLARTVDGFVYAATHIGTGPTVNLYTMASRPALNKLAKVGAIVTIVPGAAFASATTGKTISACSVEMEPIQWRQTVSDVSTVVAVDWREQTLNTDGLPAPTDRTLTLTDPDKLAEFGAMRLATRTELTSSANATLVAEALLARLSAGTWTISGVAIDTGYQQDMDPALLDTVMALLDATTRIGLPILITDIPASSPTPSGSVALYVEGGRYLNVDGAWRLSLYVSSSGSSGASTVKWDDLDATWQWDQFDPGIRWMDLQGVTI